MVPQNFEESLVLEALSLGPEPRILTRDRTIACTLMPEGFRV